jgi:hypothetical protein
MGRRLLVSVDTDTFLPPEQTVEALRGALAGAISGNGFQLRQLVPQSTWVITLPNDLGRLPAVTIYDDLGEVVEADVTATSTVVSISFPAPATGTAIIS